MAQHPLEPLDADEFRQTVAALRREQSLTQSWRFASIELEEPPKAEVKAWRAGDPVRRRRSRCCGTGPTTRPGRASSTSPTTGCCPGRTCPGVTPNFTVDEYHDVDEAMRAHPDVVAALAERGITDMSLVLIEVWTYGTALMPEQWRDRRLGWCDVWYRATPDGQPLRPPGLRASSSSST